MLLGAFESATELAGVALVEDGTVVAEVRAIGRRLHAETLLPALDETLALAGHRLEDLDAVAVDTGPGLFTGLRVGVATAKGLAQGRGIGVLGVSSLDVLAHLGADTGWPGSILAVVDARRAEVFAARYDNAGGSETVNGARLVRPEVLAGELAKERAEDPDGPPLLLVGDGARRYAEQLTSVEGTVLAGASLAHPTPGGVGVLASRRLVGGAVALPPEAVVPQYLREADARINWITRTGVDRGR